MENKKATWKDWVSNWDKTHPTCCVHNTALDIKCGTCEYEAWMAGERIIGYPKKEEVK